jgi:quercetin dioxygenase-like cupin family protein
LYLQNKNLIIMHITHINQKPFQPATHENPDKPGVLKKVLFGKDELDPDCGLRMVNYAVIQPGEAFQNHYHQTMEEVFYILSGEGEITINGETEAISAQMAVVIPKQSTHVMKNTGTGPLEYLAFGAAKEIGPTIVVPDGKDTHDND